MNNCLFKLIYLKNFLLFCKRDRNCVTENFSHHSIFCTAVNTYKLKRHFVLRFEYHGSIHHIISSTSISIKSQGFGKMKKCSIGWAVLVHFEISTHPAHGVAQRGHTVTVVKHSWEYKTDLYFLTKHMSPADNLLLLMSLTSQSKDKL